MVKLAEVLLLALGGVATSVGAVKIVNGALLAAESQL
jgi:hypothetical protein